jgi:hypothetical protein
VKEAGEKCTHCPFGYIANWNELESTVSRLGVIYLLPVGCLKDESKKVPKTASLSEGAKRM